MISKSNKKRREQRVKSKLILHDKKLQIKYIGFRHLLSSFERFYHWSRDADKFMNGCHFRKLESIREANMFDQRHSISNINNVFMNCMRMILNQDMFVDEAFVYFCLIFKWLRTSGMTIAIQMPCYLVAFAKFIITFSTVVCLIAQRRSITCKNIIDRTHGIDRSNYELFNYLTNQFVPMMKYKHCMPKYMTRRHKLLKDIIMRSVSQFSMEISALICEYVEYKLQEFIEIVRFVLRGERMKCEDNWNRNIWCDDEEFVMLLNYLKTETEMSTFVVWMTQKNK